MQPAYSASDERAIRRIVRARLDLARRRKAWIVLTTLGVSIVVAVVALRLPSVYRAEALILVDLEKVPESVVPAGVTRNTSDRWSTIRKAVLSPVRLGPLVKEFGLYPELRGKASEQELVSRVQRATMIKTVEPGGTPSNVFRIAFTDTNPNQVAPVANRLASLFMETNPKAREAQVKGTSDSLETELEETKRQLEEKAHLVQEARSRYVTDPPESKQYHLEAVNRLRDQIRNSQDQVNRDSQSKRRLQTMARNSASTIDPVQQGTASESPLQARLRELDMELQELQGRYAPDHPSVVKLRHEIERLKAKAESGKGVFAPADPRVKMSTHQIEAEVNKLDRDIAEQTKNQTELEQQIQVHLGRLQQVSAFEQRIAGLTADYESLRDHYSQLQAKRLDADVAGQLESPQAGERFKILQAAVPPQAPAGPERAVMIAGGVFFGLMCGMLVAFLVELSDRSVRHERDAGLLFGKPVLAAIPKIANDRERRRAFWRMASLSAGAAVAAVALGLAISRMVL